MGNKAFLAGINDYQTIGDLRGCVNDTASLKNLLCDQFGFERSSVRVRTNQEVTKKELNKGWKWLLAGVVPGDRLVFHFSGHGSYTADLDQDESGNADELLCLYEMDWKNPDSYLLDDELREWTKQIPEGVSVTFILDCCHSGTGTRMVLPPASRTAKPDLLKAASLVDVETSERRLDQASDATRSLSHRARGTVIGDLVPESTEAIGEANVLARFAPPPAEIEQKVRQAKQRNTFRDVIGRAAATSRNAGTASMNHVLWAGCRDDQTSADAYINGDFHGAFTYYFCETIRSQPREPASQNVVAQLRDALSQNGFSQVPQLEPAETSTMVFDVQKKAEGTTTPASDSTSSSSGCAAIGSGDMTELIGVLKQIAEQLARASRGQESTAAPAGRGLVSVHGICVHPAGFSDAWWEALSPHLSPALRTALAGNRQEVLWSRHVSPTDRAVSAVDAAEQREVEQRLRDILRERAVREVSHEIARSAAAQEFAAGASSVRSAQPIGPVPRAALGIPGLDCVDDFAKYLLDDRVRSAVLAEFSSVVRPLLERGDAIELISHSWGTVVAFEGLRQLESMGLPGRVHTWFTVGAALSIAYVADRLRPGDGRKPLMVDRWVNVDARGDIVGGSLQAVGMSVDVEYLDLEPVGCRGLGPFVSPACAHSSYFNVANSKVNRDIFAAMLSR